MKKLFLLDAMALIYRAYYAMIKSPRLTTNGLNTSAAFGFTNVLYELLRNEHPTHIAVAFDTGAPTLRHADFDNYKANREATPDDIVSTPKSGRYMEVWNNHPGLQVYTGARTAIALESQMYPDSPNHEFFPSTTLRPGEKYEHTVIYNLSVK